MQIKSPEKISLIELLSKLYKESSKNRLRKWIDQGRVLVEGKERRLPSDLVRINDRIEIRPKAAFAKGGIKILYEDRYLIVIDKMAGLLSVARESGKGENAHDLLKKRLKRGRVYPVHRLDQDTSGLLVFAYTEKVRDHLKKQLLERTMQREYRAWVHGNPGKGVWRGYLAEDAHMRVHCSSLSEGKEAITHFEAIEQKGDLTLLKLFLKTGRKHQIRVQAKEAGCPIVGDSRYGLLEDRKKEFTLRAVALSFTHPITQKKLSFST